MEEKEWKEAWSSEIHSNEYAEKRIKSAKAAKLTPQSIDTEAGSGIFKGSGKSPYNVTLKSCTCVDFIRNKLPCKHIYRLALELGCMEGQTDSYQNGAMSWQEVADQVEELPDNVQSVFCNFICGMKKDEVKWVRKKKRPEFDLLIEKGILIADKEKETAQFYTMSILPDFSPEVYKVYQYFNRKYNPPTNNYLTTDGEIVFEYKPLANDDRTERLIKKGFAVVTENGTYIKNHLPE